ncbi:TonB-dependent receptor [Thalassotalea hakodatensis]|uniref:TonB-dependent receptor n=1 Tax=Thalassotalea hakodatensis TaxID=3030492 RepID=UPI002572AE70|nr:TonB-dependent receptor [Thalassotalea hakodatensis]
MNNIIAKSFKRSVTAAAVAVSLGVAMPAIAASNTAGSINGEATANTKITYTNVKTGSSRTITVGEDGRFRVGSVPAGTYKVTNAAGDTKTIQVVIGTGSSVDFTSTEVIEVVGRAINAIDTSSVESTSVFTFDEIQKLPLPRNSVAVALLTPGAIQGGSNFGRNLPSFGGSSIGENGYYIDGMDVTNLRSLLQFANLPQDAIAQTQVKSGGYGVEYGRALGGIVNIVTKSGSNDWEFGGSAYYSPDSLRASQKNVTNVKVNGDVDISGYNSEDKRDSLKYNFYAGGPIIEDKLFFFANVEGQDYESDNYGLIDSSNSKTDTPNYLAKLDWYITDDHLLRFTHINNETEWDRTNYQNAEDVRTVGHHGNQTSQYTYKEGGDINVLSYTGYITDDLTLNLMYGELKHQYLKVPNLSGDDCPYAWDTTNGSGWSGRNAIGCWNAPVQSLVTDQVDDVDERTSWKADVDWVVGDHTIRFGYNSEEYDSTSPGVKYSGDIYYRYFTAHENNNCTVNQTVLPCGTEAVRVITYNTQTATFGVENTAWYLEDSWRYSDDLVIYGGLRGETFSNLDGNGDVFLESDTLVAPRVGFSWDVDGDGSKKLYGTLGRYYIPVASNTNIRATRQEEQNIDYYEVSGGWNADGSPVGGLGEQFGPIVRDLQIPNPQVISDQNLEPMYQDEIIIGYQQEYNEDWTLGAKFMGRTVGNGMDDFCANDGFTNWAADNGYDNFDPHSLAGCIIVNPGEDITIFMDLENDGNLVKTTTPAEYHGLPEYKRHYLGLELTAEKALSDNWKANFSYVLSRTWGNVEGYVNSSLAQEDAGATQDFDHANFMKGAYGNLPTDRTHQLKAYGLYEVNDELAVSVNFSATSGIPLSCQGFVSTDGMLVGDGSTSYDFGNFNRYGASSFYCVGEDGEQELNKRGDEGRSNWLFNTDMSVIYQPGWSEGLTLRASVYNVFNTQRPDTYDQQKDLARGNTGINANFLRPTGYQPRRYVQLSAHYSF